MATKSISEARASLPATIEQAQTEAVILERHGRPAAVMISAERHAELLDALEELEDITAYDEAIAEEGDNIPWEQVKADLGLA